MKNSFRVATAVATLGFAHSAFADCDDKTVAWLQAHHYSPAAAMAWCAGSGKAPEAPKAAAAAPLSVTAAEVDARERAEKAKSGAVGDKDLATLRNENATAAAKSANTREQLTDQATKEKAGDLKTNAFATARDAADAAKAAANLASGERKAAKKAKDADNDTEARAAVARATDAASQAQTHANTAADVAAKTDDPEVEQKAHAAAASAKEAAGDAAGASVNAKGCSPAAADAVKEAVKKDGSAAEPSGNNCVQNAAAAVNPFAQFKTSTSASNGSSLTATAHIATAYMPIFNGAESCLGSKTDWCRMLGLDISATLPATSTTAPQYGKQAMLTLDGGILNLYSAFTGGRNTKFGPYMNVSDDPKKNPNPRTTTYDRIYFVATEPDAMEGLAYLKQGLGMRAVKTSMTESGMGAMGTAYLGLGFDGPLMTDLLDNKFSARTGWVVLEAYGTANAVNPHTLNALFSTKDNPTTHSGFFTLASRIKIGLPGKFYLSAEYAKAFGSSYMKTHLGDTAIISFGYNNDDSVSQPTEKKDSKKAGTQN